MKNYAEVIKIIDGGLKSDSKKVHDYSLLLAEKLRSSGEETKADRILKLIHSQHSLEDTHSISASKNTNTKNKQVPFDQESKLEIADYYDSQQLNRKTLYLSPFNDQQIDEFIKSYDYSDKLAAHGLDIATTLLLYGPPGCGKTETAFMIAKKLSLPIVVARLDTLISSYLGNTSKNIRLLFEYASHTPCVLFLDEFDAVAKLRDDHHEMGELKRVVNSLLQNIDQLGDKCILIGATNHEKLLDQAIWRRFSTRLHIDLPSEDIIKAIIKQYVADFEGQLDEKQIDLLSNIFVGQSVSDIEQIVKRGFRKSIIEDREVHLADMVDTFFSFVRLDFEQTNQEDTRRMKIRYLLSKLKNPSRRTLGELLRCHHNTISNDLEKIKMNKGD
ncbi:AAA family ATPase [Paenibacillus polysaccharolyticus]|uniref:AAA family ATPase n=1 Tax=Paenibacillus polysaccharolyticus TaxID=582692 RepID=UPI0020A183F1|nr:AAA family ATPase [Paenibacillus polysaccharolyticus]MCP1136294.1 AAA family ATPase [Paenibacillus polysaccharolyticus]